MKRKEGNGPEGQRSKLSLSFLSGVTALVVLAAFVAACAPRPATEQVSANPAADSKAKAVSQVANQDAKFFLYVETLAADRPSVYGYIAPRGCTPSGVFKRTERVVFRFEALDVATGKEVSADEAASVKLKLPYGVVVPADYKQRGEGRIADAPWTWDVCWDVPPDYPMGVLDYSVLITLKDGRAGTWRPPALVDPGRGIDTRPQVID